MFPPTMPDDRLSPKAWVLGVESNGKFKAYPVSTLEEVGPAFLDSLNGKDYVVCWDEQARSAKVVDQKGGHFPTLTTYWLAWFAFHPETEVFHIHSHQTTRGQKSFNSVC